MPTAPVYSQPLNEELPRIRCTENMRQAVSFAAEKHSVSLADVMRACIAHSLKLYGENSEIVTRMFRKAAKEDPDDGENPTLY